MPGRSRTSRDSSVRTTADRSRLSFIHPPETAAEAAAPGVRRVPASDRSRRPSRLGKPSRDTAARRRPSPQSRSRSRPKPKPPVPHVGMSSPPAEAAGAPDCGVPPGRSLDRAASHGVGGSFRVCTTSSSGWLLRRADLDLRPLRRGPHRFPRGRFPISKEIKNSPLELHFSLGVRTFSARLIRSAAWEVPRARISSSPEVLRPFDAFVLRAAVLQHRSASARAACADRSVPSSPFQRPRRLHTLRASPTFPPAAPVGFMPFRVLPSSSRLRRLRQRRPS